jgi:hypothetical protein
MQICALWRRYSWFESMLRARRMGCPELLDGLEARSNGPAMNQRDDLSQLPTREPPAPVSGNAFVYILACSDGAVYVGSAGDVAKRLAEHGDQRAQSLLAIIQVDD